MRSAENRLRIIEKVARLSNLILFQISKYREEKLKKEFLQLEEELRKEEERILTEKIKEEKRKLHMEIARRQLDDYRR